MKWSPARAGRTKRTSGSSGASANKSTSRLAALRVDMGTKNRTAPAPAASPKRRATQPPSLTPVATSEGRAMPPVSLTTTDVSGGRATPATVASANKWSGPAEFEGLGVSSRPRVGRGGSDSVRNKDLSMSGTETDKAIPPPVLGGREAARLEWTAGGPTGTVESRTGGMFTVCKYLMARLSLHRKWRWRLRPRILFLLRLMINT